MKEEYVEIRVAGLQDYMSVAECLASFVVGLHSLRFTPRLVCLPLCAEKQSMHPPPSAPLMKRRLFMYIRSVYMAFVGKSGHPVLEFGLDSGENPGAPRLAVACLVSRLASKLDGPDKPQLVKQVTRQRNASPLRIVSD